MAHNTVNMKNDLENTMNSLSALVMKQNTEMESTSVKPISNAVKSRPYSSGLLSLAQAHEEAKRRKTDNSTLPFKFETGLAGKQKLDSVAGKENQGSTSTTVGGQAPIKLSLADLAARHSSTASKPADTSSKESLPKFKSSDKVLSTSAFKPQLGRGHQMTGSVKCAKFELSKRPLSEVYTDLIAQESMLGKMLIGGRSDHCQVEHSLTTSGPPPSLRPYACFSYSYQRKGKRQVPKVQLHEVKRFDFSSPSPDDVIAEKQSVPFSRNATAHSNIGVEKSADVTRNVHDLTKNVARMTFTNKKQWDAHDESLK